MRADNRNPPDSGDFRDPGAALPTGATDKPVLVFSGTWSTHSPQPRAPGQPHEYVFQVLGFAERCAAAVAVPQVLGN